MELSSIDFSRIARITGLVVFVGFFLLTWFGYPWLAITLLLAGLSLLYLLKSLVKEPLLDERIIEIHRISSDMASRTFTIIMMIGIFSLAAMKPNDRLLAGLEISLGLFLLLKLTFTKYYEGKI